MKKILNSPDDFVDETLNGVLAAFPQHLRAVDGDSRAIVRSDAPVTGNVGIVTGGGSGHLPVFLGYVGRGLCSGVAVGNVFSSPSAETVEAVARAGDVSQGVLFLYGNYGGDVMSFDEAAEELEATGVEVGTVVGTDDVASAPESDRERRRGVAGLFFAYKVAGAAAERGSDLADVKRAAQEAVDSTRTMGVGLSPCVLPTTGQPTFEIGADELEVGIGIHGERGARRGAMASADALATELTDAVLAELPGAGDVAVLINSLGATSLEELFILYGRVQAIVTSRGLRIHRSYVGRYATSLEMAGASISVMALTPERAELLDAPAESPFFVQTARSHAAS